MRNARLSVNPKHDQHKGNQPEGYRDNKQPPGRAYHSARKRCQHDKERVCKPVGYIKQKILALLPLGLAPWLALCTYHGLRALIKCQRIQDDRLRPSSSARSFMRRSSSGVTLACMLAVCLGFSALISMLQHIINPARHDFFHHSPSLTLLLPSCARFPFSSCSQITMIFLLCVSAWRSFTARHGHILLPFLVLSDQLSARLLDQLSTLFAHSILPNTQAGIRPCFAYRASYLQARPLINMYQPALCRLVFVSYVYQHFYILVLIVWRPLAL